MFGVRRCCNRLSGGSGSWNESYCYSRYAVGIPPFVDCLATIAHLYVCIILRVEKEHFTEIADEILTSMTDFLPLLSKYGFQPLEQLNIWTNILFTSTLTLPLQPHAFLLCTSSSSVKDFISFILSSPSRTKKGMRSGRSVREIKGLWKH